MGAPKMVKDHWYLIIPWLLEALFFLTMWVLGKTVYRQIYSDVDDAYYDAPFPMPEEINQPAHVDKQGQPQGKFWWVRMIEILMILYHFPVIAPTCCIRKDETTPGFILYLVTPVAYGLILFALFR
jgi:hypothetical protein